MPAQPSQNPTNPHTSAAPASHLSNTMPPVQPMPPMMPMQNPYMYSPYQAQPSTQLQNGFYPQFAPQMGMAYPQAMAQPMPVAVPQSPPMNSPQVDLNSSIDTLERDPVPVSFHEVQSTTGGGDKNVQGKPSNYFQDLTEEEMNRKDFEKEQFRDALERQMRERGKAKLINFECLNGPKGL